MLAGGHICLNWRLVTMPEWVRDYVLIHELMHLKRMDHSRKFWKLVAAACPNYREARLAARSPQADLRSAVVRTLGPPLVVRTLAAERVLQSSFLKIRPTSIPNAGALRVPLILMRDDGVAVFTEQRIGDLQQPSTSSR